MTLNRNQGNHRHLAERTNGKEHQRSPGTENVSKAQTWSEVTPESFYTSVKTPLRETQSHIFRYFYLFTNKQIKASDSLFIQIHNQSWEVEADVGRQSINRCTKYIHKEHLGLTSLFREPSLVERHEFSKINVSKLLSVWLSICLQYRVYSWHLIPFEKCTINDDKALWNKPSSYSFTAWFKEWILWICGV